MKITGMDAVTLAPSAGAQGEFVGMQMIMAYHRKKGSKRNVVIIPDSAHGTNPASSALCGYEVSQVKSDENGILSPGEVKKLLSENTAGLMVTIPNTLGIFERNISEISRMVHDAGGLVYCDGANLNAVVGLVDFKAMGVDAMHLNLHKTFSTPHGGGGPGSGPVAVSGPLKNFLPVPVVVKDKKGLRLSHDVADSIGRIKPFYGNFGVILRALAYILSLGEDGLKDVRENAVLNANYIRASLKDVYHLPYETDSFHEVVFSDKNFKERGIATLDIAKRLMDFGFHPPTVYFPLIVKGALMIEPTETESKEELDKFVEAMRTIAREIDENPDILHSAPNNLGIKRLDEVYAAKNPRLTWFDK
jgi:glycine dehydrogenase subunit 2